jgi:hypothetical protein
MRRTMHGMLMHMPFMLIYITPSIAAAAQHAHEHGIAKLQVAVDGPTLTLNFSSALDNLLGFEHAPRTPQERTAAADLTARLRKPDALLIPSPAANCALTSARLDAPVLERKGTAPARNEGGKGSTSVDTKGSSKSRHDHDHKSEHADLSVEYLFRCENPQALRGLEVKLFERFRRLRQVNVQIAGPKGQSAANLTSSRQMVSW